MLRGRGPTRTSIQRLVWVETGLIASGRSRPKADFYDSVNVSWSKLVQRIKSLLFFLCFTVSAWAARDANTKQARLLEKLPGASVDLSAKLACVKNKNYPDDIDKCGVSGFSSRAYQKKVEDCLWSKTGVLVPLRVAANGRYIKAMLSVSCPTMQVVAEFEARSGKYSLVYIGELVE